MDFTRTAGCSLMRTAVALLALALGQPALADISTAQQLDEYLAGLVDEYPAPVDWVMYSIKPFNAGQTIVAVVDASGTEAKYSIWLRKGKSGRFDQFVLANGEHFEHLYQHEGRMPLSNALRKRIQDTGGKDALAAIMEKVKPSDGTIALADIIASRIFDGYTDVMTWHNVYGEIVDVGNATPHKIYTRVAPNGDRVAITEAQFAETTNIKRTLPRIQWTTQNYAPGQVVDESQLLQKPEAQFNHTQFDPAIRPFYDQRTAFADATLPLHNAGPEMLINAAAVPGSRLIILPPPSP